MEMEKYSNLSFVKDVYKDWRMPKKPVEFPVQIDPEIETVKVKFAKENGERR
jgi:hypothetical protein